MSQMTFRKRWVLDNANTAIKHAEAALRHAKDEGLGVDVVSELEAALNALEYALTVIEESA